MKLSFIIPIYNTDKFVGECIRSILNINCNDYEIILVDDGSKDKSGDICKAFAQKDGRIRYYKKNNGGVSSARNYGIEKAHGEYITFVDSDDFLIADSINFLQNDDLYCESISLYNGNVTKIPFLNTNNTETNFIEYPVYMNSVCNKFFRREVIVKNNIRFAEELYASEDLFFVIQYLQHAKIVKYIEGNYYVYRENNQSTTHNLTLKTIENNRSACNKIIMFLKENDTYYRLQRYLRIKSTIEYLINIDYYDVKKYKDLTSIKDIWIYNQRLDLFLITLLAQLNITLPSVVYRKIKARKYRTERRS